MKAKEIDSRLQAIERQFLWLYGWAAGAAAIGGIVGTIATHVASKYLP